MSSKAQKRSRELVPDGGEDLTPRKHKKVKHVDTNVSERSARKSDERRSSDGAVRSSDSFRVDLASAPTDPTHCPPFLVSFPLAPPPLNLLNNGDKGIRFEAFRNADPRKTRQEIIRAQSEKMIYKGTNFGEDSFASSVSRYVVGVYHKSTGKVDLVETAGIFVMHQRLKSQPEEINDQEFKGLSYSEKRKSLGDAFGSRRQLRKTKIDEAALVTAESTPLTSAIADQIATKAEAEPEADDRRADLPPYDVNAATLADAYDVSGVTGFNESEPALRVVAKAMKSPDAFSEACKELKLSRFVGAHFSAEQYRNLKKKQRKLLAPYILAVGYLLTLHNRAGHRGDLDRRKLLEEKLIPETVLTRFLYLFAEKKDAVRFHMTSAHRTKLRNWLAIVLLCASKYEVAVEPIAAELKIEKNAGIDIFRSVGCSISTKTKATEAGTEKFMTAKLKVPLSFPTVTKKGTNIIPRNLWQ